VVFEEKSREFQITNHNSQFLPGKDVYYTAASSRIKSEKKQPNNMYYLLVFTSKWLVAWRPRLPQLSRDTCACVRLFSKMNLVLYCLSFVLK